MVLLKCLPLDADILCLHRIPWMLPGYLLQHSLVLSSNPLLLKLRDFVIYQSILLHIVILVICLMKSFKWSGTVRPIVLLWRSLSQLTDVHFTYSQVSSNSQIFNVWLYVFLAGSSLTRAGVYCLSFLERLSKHVSKSFSWSVAVLVLWHLHSISIFHHLLWTCFLGIWLILIMRLPVFGLY